MDGLKWTHFLNELFLYFQLLSSYTMFPRGPECSVRQFLQQGGRISRDLSKELNISCIDNLLIERFGWKTEHLTSQLSYKVHTLQRFCHQVSKFPQAVFCAAFLYLIFTAPNTKPSNSHSKKFSLCLSNSDADHTRATQGMLKMSVLWLLVRRKWAPALNFHYSSAHWPYTYSRSWTTVPYTLVIHSNQCANAAAEVCRKAVAGVSTLLSEYHTLNLVIHNVWLKE